MAIKKDIPEINKRFLEVILKKGYSGYKLSKEVKEISESKLTHIRSGRNEPSKDLINALLNKFPDVSYDWLVNGSGEMLGDSNSKEDYVYEDEDKLEMDKFLDIFFDNIDEIEKNSRFENYISGKVKDGIIKYQEALIANSKK